MFKLDKILFIVLVLVFIPITVSAAVLYMDPSEATLGPGDTFTVALKLDTGANCINTVEANISFPQDKLKLVDFITGDSIINIWIDKPNEQNMEETNKKGMIYLAGGIPGGFCGRIPGDPGFSNIIGEAVFQIPSLTVGGDEPGEPVAKIDYLENTKAFINDGFGTLDKVVLKGAVLNISGTPSGTQKNWQQELKNDKIPPEQFVVELHRNEKMYDNKYYLIFYTTDKQTGVDHYEVIEEKPAVEKNIWQKIADKLSGYGEIKPEWKIAKIPYILEDQTLQSIIKVKAIDQAGNEQITEFIPPEAERQNTQNVSQKNLSLVLLIVVIVFGVITLCLIAYKLFKRKENKNEEE